jgi:uncharacterized membrane protein
MNLRKTEKTMFKIIGITILLSFVFYWFMPEKVACHWDAKGEVNGYMGKFWGVFTLPLIMFLISLLFVLIPRIDPLKANIEKFMNYYDGFLIVFCIFMLLIHLWVIFWNLGLHISSNITMSVLVGLLLIYSGILCKNAKRNWFIGIRTPWTLSSDVVWDKTHRIGSIFMMISGVIAVIGAFYGDKAIYFVIIPILIFAVWSFVYSYLEFKKLTPPKS